jgi:hypothetical protein
MEDTPWVAPTSTPIKVIAMNTVSPTTTPIDYIAASLANRAYRPRNLIFILLDTEEHQSFIENPTPEQAIWGGLKTILETRVARSKIKATETPNPNIPDTRRLTDDIQMSYSQDFVVVERQDKTLYNLLRRFRALQDRPIRLMMIEPAADYKSAADAWLIENGEIVNVRNGWTPARTLDIAPKGTIPLGDAVDLDAVLRDGNYQQSDGKQRCADLHYPTDRPGDLSVTTDNTGAVWQRYRVFDGTESYTRCLYQGVWSPWKMVEDVETIHTTFQIDGVLLHTLDVLDQATSLLKRMNALQPD